MMKTICIRVLHRNRLTLIVVISLTSFSGFVSLALLRESRNRPPTIVLDDTGIIRRDKEPIRWRDIRTVNRHSSEGEEICRLTLERGSVVSIGMSRLVDASEGKSCDVYEYIREYWERYRSL